jgi:hypothetical protein
MQAVLGEEIQSQEKPSRLVEPRSSALTPFGMLRREAG